MRTTTNTTIRNTIRLLGLLPLLVVAAHAADGDAAKSAPSKGTEAPATPAQPPFTEMILDLGDNITMKLVQIPAGKFLMGSPENEKGRNADEGLEARAVQGDGAEERVLGERSLPPPVGAEAPGSPSAEERSPETRLGEQPGIGVEEKNLPGPNSAKRRVRHPFQSYSDDERKSRSSSRQSRPIGWASSRI